MAGAALLLPLEGTAIGQSSGIAPPSGPLRYTRKLRCELADGTAIEAERFFAVRFVRDNAGYRIVGEEGALPRVSGPAPLEPLLKLERERREIGLFPLRLDHAGLIVTEPAEAGSPQLARAIDEALRLVHASDLDAGQRSAAAAFLQAGEQAAASLVTKPPADLFFPSTPIFEDHRNVALPDGGAGSISLRFTASADPASGLMQQAKREVVTRLGQSERRTVENWSIAPAR